MKITLKKRTLNNFKGIKFLEFTLNETVNKITGKNGTGKTTAFADASTWLLFGKDSSDRSTGNGGFEVKPLDEKNNVIHNLDSFVEDIYDIDGFEIKLKRLYREDWQKPRGQEEKVLKGHETLYYYQTALVSASEFKDVVDKIVSISLFKLLSSVTYFHQLSWTERRSELLKVAGDIPESDIIGDNKGFKYVSDQLRKNDLLWSSTKPQLQLAKVI